MSYMVTYQVFRGVDIFLTVVSYIIFAYCIMSWFVRPTNQLYMLLSRMVQPLLAPFRPIARKLIERGFMFDVSVILAYLAIRVLRSLMWQLFQWVVW